MKRAPEEMQFSKAEKLN